MNLRMIPSMAIMAWIFALGCTKPEPTVVPVVEEKQPALVASVLSTPGQAMVTLKDHTIGLTPQSVPLGAATDLLQLNASIGNEIATEKRIRFISPERAEVHFVFGKDRSPFAKALGLSKVLVFEYGEGITFDVDQSDLRPGFQALLERQADMLKAHFTDLDIYVCGHTDSTGNITHNLALSLARAQTVARQLETLGIPKSRLKVQGFGSAYPVAGNDTAEGKALNRRTEIVLPQ